MRHRHLPKLMAKASPTQQSGTWLTSICVPTINEGNNIGFSPFPRMRRFKRQREAVQIAFVGAPKASFRPRYVVTLTRLTSGRRRTGHVGLDSDGLASALKHVRDSVADELGVDDGDEDKITWLYENEAGKRGDKRVWIKVQYGC